MYTVYGRKVKDDGGQKLIDDALLSKEQNVFRKRKPCINVIFTLKIKIVKRRKFN